MMNGNHSRGDSAEIEEIELDSLAEKTHEELMTTIKSENANSPSLSANWNCQVGFVFKFFKLYNINLRMTGLRGEIRLRVQTLQPCRQCHRQTDQVSAKHRFFLFTLVLDQNFFSITDKIQMRTASSTETLEGADQGCH